MSSTSGLNEGDGAKLGGARADFVASLGKKVAGARELLAVLRDDPTSQLVRDELRRRLHALASGARLLHFDAMGRALQETLAIIDNAVEKGELEAREIAFAGRALDELPALAWDANISEPGSASITVEPASRPPATVLVIGGSILTEAFIEDPASGRAFECESTDDIDSALQLARAYAPDVVVIDVDLSGASRLLGALREDPLTEPVPIVVVGTMQRPEEAEHFATLGVVRTLAKPVAAEVVRATCEEVLEGREGRTLRMTLGEPTLEQLAERLAGELRAALLDSVDIASRERRVPLGEGSEIMGALWGAIARVQAVVTQKTSGAIQFLGGAPEGAFTMAPWLHQEIAQSDRGRGTRSSTPAVSLKGRRVVVADDDPGVTWFISDLLRTAGCEVHEALDGLKSLELTFRLSPDLVVSDILMPGLDGFAFCRALRRDVALRDTPVILLSWKEDLLQRVRELGASAAAYMRKETDSRAILARVREVLLPRARIESRLCAGGDVRGRLDGLSPRLLLELVCSMRQDARVDVRDAAFVYEIEIRHGAPRKATRTATDGSYKSGARMLASLLGVGAGRFTVSAATAPVHGDLVGTLAEQLAGPVAAARGALAATTGAATVHVERIGLDSDGLEEYLRSTPDPARTLIRQLAAGRAPRRLLFDGQVSPSLLEDVLADLSARGLVKSVEGPGGVDLLSSRVEAAFATSQGRALPVLRSAVGGARSSEGEHSPTEDHELAPSSLEDAVMREISDRSPSPGAAQMSQLPPLVEPSTLRPRTSSPPDELGTPYNLDTAFDDAAPSIAPDAIIPGTVPDSGSYGVSNDATQGALPMTVPIAKSERAVAVPPEPTKAPMVSQVTVTPRSRPAQSGKSSSRALVLGCLAFFLLCVAVAAALFFEGDRPPSRTSGSAPTAQ